MRDIPGEMAARIESGAATLCHAWRVTRADGVELEGPLAALDRRIGRTYGRLCEARLGDGRCRVDLEAHPGVRCDKRWETCVGTFANGVNFRGFPDIPGDDFIAAHPVDGGRHDGRSRR